ncbi:MAG TPA: choice-of-anchor tandem repeat GloVer-containing protein [Rhizomicrobium sp.]|nr:choice-of-anchor tandem repeat GloVer-containing protein [Rhizomicrobium sp.]
MKTVSIALLAGIVCCAFVRPAAAAAAASYTEKVVWSFRHGTDGHYPSASLIDVGGVLYGTTLGGGGTGCKQRHRPHGCGTVFAFNPGSGAERVLYSFAGGTDGFSPEAGLIDVRGILYGTTANGGGLRKDCKHKCGIVFLIDPNTGAETVLHSFLRRPEGLEPEADLVYLRGKLYGTTAESDAYDGGTVFSISLHHDAVRVVHSFSGGTDGGYPLAGLIDLDGTLYGTTARGGAHDDGTVFSLDPGTGAETVIHSFYESGHKDGSYPVGGLTADSNGILYGTTVFGGAHREGTVFALDPTTGAETVLHSFGGRDDGQDAEAGLIDVKGMLYGTTRSGGTHGWGTVFSVDADTGAETVLHSFAAGADGAYPQAGLIDVDSTLYGTTEWGGVHHRGTIFALTKDR